MSNKMIIDASHPEETRVVVLRGNRVEEFDFEAATRQQLKGNIYLAKVTRVEPSLQAAFIEYGGNRHGFLAFSEIHPDYYQIPYADRQALIEAEAEEDAENEAAEAESAAGDAFVAGTERADPDASEGGGPLAEGLPDETRGESPGPSAMGEESVEDKAWLAEATGALHPDEMPGPDEAAGREAGEDGRAMPAAVSSEGDRVSAEAPAQDDEENGGPESVDEPEEVESVGAVDAMEEVPQRRTRTRQRQYKIQEVIKRRQVLLVQVVKEERGNKGAALTTYLSLAGRYSVLMPNTGRGGGISRKITSAADRKRLKEIATDLEVPDGMGVILRTAGANRTKPEIKRDFEYLLRLWENIRELTLRSTAPALVYEEGSLIKRSIRDLYSREIDEVLVAGDEGYKDAKEFMRMLMPSHAKNVQPYKDAVPIFSRFRVESQLDAMFSPHVTLRSGGYIVINQTEALVAIDVNSGRSTREHSIEDTALQTNLEAAEEISRQLRLRDLAGLIVIDFIDMEEKRNGKSVERRLKDCLRFDRARIQVGRISHFGLLEMSRQRIRTGVLESSTELCAHCHGTGQVRSVASLALQILRAVEDQLLRSAGHHLRVHTRPDAALYMLNQKRAHLVDLEERFGLTISVVARAPENGQGFAIERAEPVDLQPVERRRPVALLDLADASDDAAFEVVSEDEEEAAPRDEEASLSGDGRDGERNGRRRGRRRGRRGEAAEGARDAERPLKADEEGAEAEDGAEQAAVSEAAGKDADGEAEDGDGSTRSAGEDSEARRRRRRGRRGGRRREGEAVAGAGGDDLAGRDETDARETVARETSAGDEDFGSPGATAPRPVAEEEPGEGTPRDDLDDRVAAEPAPALARSDFVDAVEAPLSEPAEAPRQAEERTERPSPARPTPPVEAEGPPRPKRIGWWTRRSFF